LPNFEKIGDILDLLKSNGNRWVMEGD